MCGKDLAAMQVLDLAKEREPACRVGVGERSQKQPPEQAGEHWHRQEEAGLAAYPARAVKRYPAARHDNMHVRMVGERRSPGVEHGGGADARRGAWDRGAFSPRACPVGAIVSSVSAAVRNSRS